MPSNILNLPAYTVLVIEETEHDYHIKAEVKEPFRHCRECGSADTVSNGRRQTLVKDLPSHGKRVGIYIQARRLLCKACESSFTEPLPAISADHEMTNRLVEWIQQQSIQRTFASVASDTGIDERTIRRIFNVHIEELDKTLSFETPEYLGIDEIHIQQPRCVLTNIKERTIVDMLEDRSKKTVSNYLTRMENRKRVSCVSMDMWAPYKDSVRAVLPKATIVIDKFHVLKLANEALEKARKQIKDQMSDGERKGLKRERFILLKRNHDLTDIEHFKLSGWLRNYPQVAAAYSAKESFYSVYDAKSPNEAKRLFRAWAQTVDPSVGPMFSELVRAWVNWEDYIINYFTHPVTNAYTECLNNLIEVIWNRNAGKKVFSSNVSRGYSFEAIRAEVLFNPGIHQIVDGVNYGVDIRKFQEKISRYPQKADSPSRSAPAAAP